MERRKQFSRISPMKLDSNIVWRHATVTRELRQEQNGRRAVPLWFTGLSGVGKSTLAHVLEEQLQQHIGGC